MKLMRLAYLLAQHPIHAHRELVRRGLALGWLDDFRPFWDLVRPASLPITDYASFQWLAYHFASRLRAKYPTGDHFDDPDAAMARLLSYVLRREMHPLRWLPLAWHLRGCRAVVEFGSGAAPYAHGVDTAWPGRQEVIVADLPGMLHDYCRWRFERSERVQAVTVDGLERAIASGWYADGWVVTEVFEHLHDPILTARWIVKAARRVVCFDFVEEPGRAFTRRKTLEVFRESGELRGPDRRGLYVWRSGIYQGGKHGD